MFNDALIAFTKKYLNRYSNSISMQLLFQYSDLTWIFSSGMRDNYVNRPTPGIMPLYIIKILLVEEELW